MSDRLTFKSGPLGVSAHMFCGGEINLKLGLQTARESPGRLCDLVLAALAWIGFVCSVTSFILLWETLSAHWHHSWCRVSILIPSRSDPERPRGPGVHKPHVWNSKPFTITSSTSEFLPDQSWCLGFEKAISFEWLYLLTFSLDHIMELVSHQYCWEMLI